MKFAAHKNIHIKLAILALVLIGVIVFANRIYVSILSFSKPVTPNLTQDRQKNWDGESVINVVFTSYNPDNSSAISLVSVHPKEKRATLLNISDQTYLELPKGFGSWPIGSVFRLGELEKDKMGAYLLKLSASKLMGLPVDGIVMFDKKSYKLPEKLLSDWRRNPFGPYLVLDNVKSDMTKSEVLKLFTMLSGVREDRIETLNLERSNITESKLLPDSTRVLGVDTIRLDLFVRDKMGEEDILSEGVSVAVFNATDYPGLTREAVRTITNLGGNVIIVGNTEVRTATSLVVFGRLTEDETKQGYTQKRLKQIFAPHCLETECFISDPKIDNSRAQINVILGEDYYKKWYTR